MVFRDNCPRQLIVGVALVVLSGGLARAQYSPLVAYADDASLSCCDLVNAASLELGVLSDTRELVILSGVDVVLVDTYVDDNRDVYFSGTYSGTIEYAEDGDGFRTLWWLTSGGTVVDLDLSTIQPFDSGLFVSDFFDVPCDGCVLWDDALNCDGLVPDEDLDGVRDCDDFCPGTSLSDVVDVNGCACGDYDSDLDGVDDCDDLCTTTPADSLVDFDGCACFELDDDLDGVDNCNDLCSQTPIDALVDSDGCEIVVVVDDGSGGGGGGGNVNSISLMCGSFSALSLAMTLAGLMTLGFGQRRR